METDVLEYVYIPSTNSGEEFIPQLNLNYDPEKVDPAEKARWEQFDAEMQAKWEQIVNEDIENYYPSAEII